MFKFLFDVMAHLQQTQGSTHALTSSIDLQDIKSETALLKAVRTNQVEMVNKVLSVMKPDDLLGYESLL